MVGKSKSRCQTRQRFVFFIATCSFSYSSYSSKHLCLRFEKRSLWANMECIVCLLCVRRLWKGKKWGKNWIWCTDYSDEIYMCILCLCVGLFDCLLKKKMLDTCHVTELRVSCHFLSRNFVHGFIMHHACHLKIPNTGAERFSHLAVIPSIHHSRTPSFRKRQGLENQIQIDYLTEQQWQNGKKW